MRGWLSVLVAVSLTVGACNREGTAPKAAADDRATGAEPAAAPGTPAYAHRGSEDCAACHADIAAEWRTSMHAASTRSGDPIYRVMTDKAHAALGDKAKKKCRGCHHADWFGVGKNPIPWFDEGVEASALPIEGVSCTVCHEIHPNHPTDKLATGQTARLARSHPGATGAQGLCLSCHAEMKNPEGQPVCTTGAEFSEHGAGAACTDCHMKAEPGAAYAGATGTTHRGHRFPGGHHPAYLKGAATVGLEVEVAATGGARRVVATVTPGALGHALPTGTPLRQVWLRVRAYDEAGAVVWENYRKNALKEAPDAVFARIFANKEGRRPVPPFMAAGAPTDTRLMPGSPRVLRYPIPPTARSVDAELTYHLAPAPLLEAAGLPPKDSAPTVIATAQLEL